MFAPPVQLLARIAEIPDVIARGKAQDSDVASSQADRLLEILTEHRTLRPMNADSQMDQRAHPDEFGRLT